MRINGTLACPDTTMDVAFLDEPRLVEARRVGELFPRVPVYGVDLTCEQVAVALWSVARSVPAVVTVDELESVLRVVVGHRVELERLERLTPRFLASRETNEGRWARARAWQISMRYRYRGAVCEPMNNGAQAAALYASSLERRPMKAFYAMPDAEVREYVMAHVHEGIQTLSGVDLVALDRAVTYDHLERAVRHHHRDPAATFGVPVPSDDALRLRAELMPDRRRQRFCVDVAANWLRWWRCPMVARFPDGRMVVGSVPPPHPVFA